MMGWLRERTVFQKISLALVALALCISAVLSFSNRSPVFAPLLIALFVTLIAFRKKVLWRVRNRLLVTYFLFGVVPVILIVWLASLTVELVLGQIAAQRVRQDLTACIGTVRGAAQDLAVAASGARNSDLLNKIRLRVPRMASVIQADHETLRLPPDAALQGTPAWLKPGFAGLLEIDGRYYIGAKMREEQAEAFAYVPFDQTARSSLTQGAVALGDVVHDNAAVEFFLRMSGSSVAVVQNGKRTQMMSASIQPRGWWDISVVDVLGWTAQTASGPEQILFALLSRPSSLISRAPSSQMASIALSLMIAVACFILIVEAVSLFSSLRLTRTITRSVHDLYRGTLHVARGDFAYQMPVRGEYQLSELATSFNSMTTKINELIGEMKKKERLDAELEIARQVQLRFFPSSIPKFRTLEIGGICLPGRVVSGDYYDYVHLDDRWAAIALADISGKGVSAALLTASIQSALHAQLKFSQASRGPVLSTATLVSLIGQQLYENTPPEKYATFFCSLCNDETGEFEYTNAGHPKPILVRRGQASTLEGDGLPAGLLPNAQYEQQIIQLEAGDLIAIFSDGIPEALNAAEQEFGEARLAELLVNEANKPLADIIASVLGTVQKWIHDPEGRDDITLLLLRRL